MNVEETQIRKKLIVTCFNILSHYLPGGTEEYQDTLLKIGGRLIEVRTAYHQNTNPERCSNRNFLDNENFEEVRKC
jgi:hypothetical protein